MLIICEPMLHPRLLDLCPGYRRAARHRAGAGAGGFGNGLWGVVAAHCIHRNGQHRGTALFLRYFDYFAAFILAAVRADAVRLFGFVTVRALRKSRRLHRIVGAAVGGPPLGVTTFGIWHSSTSTGKSLF